jgi:chemotaxis protein CheD
MSIVVQPEIRVHVIQGECRISADPQVLLTTTLGSCIAACIHDPVARVGGMNHFLLPEGDGVSGPMASRYGAYAMESLINELLKAGAVRRRLEAKLFGGGRLTDSSIDIGQKNAAFATAFLSREGVEEAPGSLGGEYARRIQFWPHSGRVRQLTLARRSEAVPVRPERLRRLDTHGGLELF